MINQIPWYNAQSTCFFIKEKRKEKISVMHFFLFEFFHLHIFRNKNIKGQPIIFTIQNIVKTNFRSNELRQLDQILYVLK